MLLAVLVVSLGAAQAQTVSLYRWYNSLLADYALSVIWTPGSAAAASAGYTLVAEEGKVFSPTAPQPAGTVPLHIWYSPSRGDYFSSTEPVWRGGPGQTRSPDYTWIMLQGYVYEDPGPGRVPLYHWFNPGTGDNLETSNPAWETAGPNPRSGYEQGLVQGYLLKPARWDLTAYQTGFRNQLNRGGCSMFSVTAALEAAYKREHARAGYPLTNYELDLSEEFFNWGQKMFKLSLPYNPADSPQKAENYLGPTDGGDGIENLEFLAVSGMRLPLESAMPFHAMYSVIPAWNPWLAADLPFDPPNDWSKPMFANDQKMTDTVNLNPALLPVSALSQSLFHGVSGYETIAAANDPEAIENALASNHEVIVDVGLIGDDWLHDGTPLPNSGGAGHSMLIVGYDRTDASNPYFILKNSWGPTSVPGWNGFQHASYEFIRRATYNAGTITAVTPTSDWPELQFLGRWNLDFDGWRGTLDIYHLPGMARLQLNNAGETSPDLRLGTFFDGNGNAFRVNGSVNGTTITFRIDSGNPNARWDELGGREFNYYLFRNGPRTEMAGFHTDPDGRTYAGYARKDQSFLSGVVAAGPLEAATYLGVWNVNFDGIPGRMELTSRDDTGLAPGWAGLHGKIYYNQAGVAYTKDILLKVQLLSPWFIQLTIPAPDGSMYGFDGKMESWNPGVMAGDGTDPSGIPVSFYAYRTGDYVAPSPGTLEFTSASYSVNESGGAAVITVQRVGGSSGSISVNYETVDGSATSPADFSAVSGTLTFANGETSQTFTVPIVNDLLNEGLETLGLVLSSPTGGATLGTQSSATLEIVDDDPVPAISINDLVVTVGNSGILRPVFTVKLSAPSALPVQLRAATADGTAIAGVDYTGISAPAVVFAPGETTAIIQVPITPHLNQGDDLRFYLRLTDPMNAEIADAEGECLIKTLRVLSIRFDGDDLVLSFPTGNIGQYYHVERTDNLGPTASWIQLTPPEGILGTGDLITFRDIGARLRPTGFYRVAQTNP